MNAPLSPLDRPASIPVLRRLLEANVISPAEEHAMEAQVRRELPWKAWLDRNLLCLGVVLILSGIGYFFAHNWNHLTDNDKLGLSGGAVFLALIIGTWVGLENFVGKLLLLAASALVGVFLAVFGQVYQTGAENYELFTGWALLIVPWVALGRFMPLWIFWIALLNLALGFYWPVTPIYFFLDGFDTFRQETLSLLLLNGVALLVREWVATRPPTWLDRAWSRLILLAATAIPASLYTIHQIFDTWNHNDTQGITVFVCFVYAAFIGAFNFFYSRVRYSLPALAILTLSACIVLTCLAIRVIDFDQSTINAGMFLFGGIVVLGIFGGGVFFLRSQRLSHPKHP